MMSMEFYIPLMPAVIYTASGSANFVTLSGSLGSDALSAGAAQAT